MIAPLAEVRELIHPVYPGQFCEFDSLIGVVKGSSPDISRAILGAQAFNCQLRDVCCVETWHRCSSKKVVLSTHGSAWIDETEIKLLNVTSPQETGIYFRLVKTRDQLLGEMGHKREEAGYPFASLKRERIILLCPDDLEPKVVLALARVFYENGVLCPVNILA